MKYLASFLVMLVMLGSAAAALAFSRGSGGFSAPPRGGGGFNMGSDVHASRPPSSRPQGGANNAYHPPSNNGYHPPNNSGYHPNSSNTNQIHNVTTPTSTTTGTRTTRTPTTTS